MKKKQFLIKIRMFSRSDNETEIDTPWTGQPFDAEDDEAFISAYASAVEGLKTVLEQLVDKCKKISLLCPGRKPVEHTVQLLCHCPKQADELYKTVKFD